MLTKTGQEWMGMDGFWGGWGTTRQEKNNFLFGNGRKCQLHVMNLNRHGDGCVHSDEDKRLLRWEVGRRNTQMLENGSKVVIKAKNTLLVHCNNKWCLKNGMRPCVHMVKRATKIFKRTSDPLHL